MKLKLKKGLNLAIKGALPADAKAEAVMVQRVAVCPDDYPGFVPKAAVKEGDAVCAGAPLLWDKNHPSLMLVSPLAGKVKAIVRGERRKIMYVEVVADAVDAQAPQLPKPADKASAMDFLARSGLMALVRRRPYDIVALPEDEVRDVFVTAFDTAPLALSLETATLTLFSKAEVEAGVAVLAKITSGKIYISHRADSKLGAVKGAEMVEVEGVHPAGNAGVQAANIKPVNKGEVIWTLDLMTLARIGRTAAKGAFDAATTVAVVGPKVAQPVLVNTLMGAPVEPLLKPAAPVEDCHLRVIAGNVLTGTAVDPGTGFLHYPYRQITVIAEGDDVEEFMGWASLSPSKMSSSRTFPGHFLKKLFSPDARMNGGRRAMIMSGQYESTMPMDILPEYLLKAIISRNIEDMESLGIYEVAPEDFAAAEYVDTSKLPLQKIVREGLDYLRKELE